MTDRQAAAKRIREHFVAMGFPEARDWTDEEIERVSAEMGGAIRTMGISFVEAEAALRRLLDALMGR